MLVSLFHLAVRQPEAQGRRRAAMRRVRARRPARLSLHGKTTVLKSTSRERKYLDTTNEHNTTNRSSRVVDAQLACASGCGDYDV